MTSLLSPLFKPLTIGSMTVPNRFAMAPMTRGKSPGQVPNDDVAAYYRRRVEGGVGLIITEGTVIDHPASDADAGVPRIYGEDALAGWANVVREVKAAGGFIAPQIWHVGAARRSAAARNPDAKSIGPSGLSRPGKQVNDPLSENEIADLIAAYASAAADSKRIGFDAVELHGAHGYLIDQFFWDGTNQRADAFGGNMVQRTRFGTDVVKAVRAAIGPDFPLILRWSQWKQQDYAAKLATTPELLETFLAPLVDAGVDVFHCSQRRFWEPEFDGSDMNLAGWVKKLTGKPTITVGSVGLSGDFLNSFVSPDEVGATASHLETLAEMFTRGDFDMVAVGRALIANPDWVNRAQTGDLDGMKAYDPKELATLY